MKLFRLFTILYSFLLTTYLLLLITIPVHAQSSLHLTHTRLYIPVGSYTTILKDNDQYYLLSKDYLSSTKVIVNESGEVSETNSYYPYGSTQQFNHETIKPSSITDKLFTSHRKLADLSVYHAGARFYSPLTGLFIQPDTVEGPQRYAYSLNNPVMYNDPTGNIVCPGCDRDYSNYPKIPQTIPDIPTHIGVIVKRTPIFDIASLGLQAFDTITGVGYQPGNDPVAQYSSSLNQYISRADMMTDMAVAMVQPMGSLTTSERLTSSIKRELLARRVIINYMTADEVARSKESVRIFHQASDVAWAFADRSQRRIAANPHLPPLNSAALAHEGQHLKQPMITGRYGRLIGLIHEVDAFTAERDRLARHLRSIGPQDPTHPYYYNLYEKAGGEVSTHLGYARSELTGLLRRGITPQSIAKESGEQNVWYLARYLGFTQIPQISRGLFGSRQSLQWIIQQ